MVSALDSVSSGPGSIAAVVTVSFYVSFRVAREEIKNAVILCRWSTLIRHEVWYLLGAK